jgi:hypothetical protein
MGVFLAAAAFALVGVTITVGVLVARHSRLSTPEARYQRDARGIKMAKHSQTTARYNPQQGDPGITPGAGSV